MTREKALIHTEPEDTEAPPPAGRSYTMWAIRATEDRPVGIMMQVEEIPQAHQQAIAMNQQLLCSRWILFKPVPRHRLTSP
jgi:hypothetical protein